MGITRGREGDMLNACGSYSFGPLYTLGDVDISLKETNKNYEYDCGKRITITEESLSTKSADLKGYKKYVYNFEGDYFCLNEITYNSKSQVGLEKLVEGLYNKLEVYYKEADGGNTLPFLLHLYSKENGEKWYKRDANIDNKWDEVDAKTGLGNREDPSRIKKLLDEIYGELAPTNTSPAVSLPPPEPPGPHETPEEDSGDSDRTQEHTNMQLQTPSTRTEQDRNRENEQKKGKKLPQLKASQNSSTGNLGSSSASEKQTDKSSSKTGIIIGISCGVAVACLVAYESTMMFFSPSRTLFTKMTGMTPK